MTHGFLLAVILLGVFYIITIGIIGLIAIMFSNARQQQEDQEFTESQIYKIYTEMARINSGNMHGELLRRATTYRPPK